MRYDDIKPRPFRVVCASGDTSVLTVPTDMLGYINDLEIDTRTLSGKTSTVTLDVRDTYTPQGGTSTTTVRKTVGVLAGDVIDVDLRAPLHVIGAVAIRSSYSGPVVSMSVLLE